MEKNKIGTYTLTGLTVGPILGSGILILPPIVYQDIHDWSILAWSIIIIIGFLFAFIFGHLSILYPGDGGVTNAIEKTFGKYIKILASSYLILGVVLGSVAVLTTAAGYVAKLGFASEGVIGYILLIVCFILLLMTIKSIGKVVLILSLVSALVLLAGGITTLVIYHTPFLVRSQFQPVRFGHSLLLLIWTILGWEVVGNYSAEVKDPKKTVFKSMVLSVFLVAIIDLVIVSAMQWSNISVFWNGEITITTIVYPLFHDYSNIVVALLTLFLCCATYLLYVGGVVRLTANLSEIKVIPTLFSKRTKQDVPIYAVIAIFIFNVIGMSLIHLHILSIEELIGMSNGFFIMNVIVGILTGILIIKSKLVKVGGVFLGLVFLFLLFYYSSVISLTIIISLAIYFVYKQISP